MQRSGSRKSLSKSRKEEVSTSKKKNRHNLLCLIFLPLCTWVKTSNPLAIPDMQFLWSRWGVASIVIIMVYIRGMVCVVSSNILFSNNRLKRCWEPKEKVSEKNHFLKDWFQDLLINNCLLVCLINWLIDSYQDSIQSDLSVCFHIKWNTVRSKTSTTIHDECMAPDNAAVINICQCTTPWRKFSCVHCDIILFRKVINIWKLAVKCNRGLIFFISGVFCLFWRNPRDGSTLPSQVCSIHCSKINKSTWTVLAITRILS